MESKKQDLLDQFAVSGSVFDDKIDEWHNSDTPLSLYEYLGLTEEQFKIWLKTPEEIEKHYRQRVVYEQWHLYTLSN